MPARFNRSPLFVLGGLALVVLGWRQPQPALADPVAIQLAQQGVRAPFIYTGSSFKQGGQDVDACIANAGSILKSNGYVDAATQNKSDDGATAWVSGDRASIGVTAEFHCTAGGVTVLGMAGFDNDKLYSEYQRIHGLDW